MSKELKKGTDSNSNKSPEWDFKDIFEYKQINGIQQYLLNGKYHRENDLPAIIDIEGSKFWYKNGLRHRELGPAIEKTNGTKEWFLNGIKLTEEEFGQWLDKKKLYEKLQFILKEKYSEKRTKL